MLPARMRAPRPNAALDLHRDLPVRPRKIKPPSPLRMKTMLPGRRWQSVGFKLKVECVLESGHA